MSLSRPTRIAIDLLSREIVSMSRTVVQGFEPDHEQASRLVGALHDMIVLILLDFENKRRGHGCDDDGDLIDDALGGT